MNGTRQRIQIDPQSSLNFFPRLEQLWFPIRSTLSLVFEKEKHLVTFVFFLLLAYFLQSEGTPGFCSTELQLKAVAQKYNAAIM